MSLKRPSRLYADRTTLMVDGGARTYWVAPQLPPGPARGATQ